MTNWEILPITAYVMGEIERMNEKWDIKVWEFSKLRSLEEASQNKTKESERERIVGILEEMTIDSTSIDAIDALRDAISHINNTYDNI